MTVACRSASRSVRRISLPPPPDFAHRGQHIPVNHTFDAGWQDLSQESWRTEHPSPKSGHCSLSAPPSPASLVSLTCSRRNLPVPARETDSFTIPPTRLPHSLDLVMNPSCPRWRVPFDGVTLVRVVDRGGGEGRRVVLVWRGTMSRWRDQRGTRARATSTGWDSRKSSGRSSLSSCPPRPCSPYTYTPLPWFDTTQPAHHAQRTRHSFATRLPSRDGLRDPPSAGHAHDVRAPPGRLRQRERCRRSRVSAASSVRACARSGVL